MTQPASEENRAAIPELEYVSKQKIAWRWKRIGIGPSASLCLSCPRPGSSAILFIEEDSVIVIRI